MERLSNHSDQQLARVRSVAKTEADVQTMKDQRYLEGILMTADQHAFGAKEMNHTMDELRIPKTSIVRSSINSINSATFDTNTLEDAMEVEAERLYKNHWEEVRTYSQSPSYDDAGSYIKNILRVLWERVARKYIAANGRFPQTESEKQQLDMARERLKKAKID